MAAKPQIEVRQEADGHRPLHVRPGIREIGLEFRGACRVVPVGRKRRERPHPMHGARGVVLRLLGGGEFRGHLEGIRQVMGIEKIDGQAQLALSPTGNLRRVGPRQHPDQHPAQIIA